MMWMWMAQHNSTGKNTATAVMVIKKKVLYLWLRHIKHANSPVRPADTEISLYLRENMYHNNMLLKYMYVQVFL